MEEGKMGEGGQKAQASRQNINNSWRYNIRLDDYSKYRTDYFQVAKRVVSLERLRHRKKKTMHGDKCEQEVLW